MQSPPVHKRKKPPAPGPPLSLTPGELNVLTQIFLTEFLREKSTETVGTYRRALNEFTRWFSGTKRDFNFYTEDVEAYKSYLAEERQLNDVSVSTYLTAVRRFCQYLVEIGLLSENSAAKVKGIRRPPGHARDVLLPGEVNRLLASVDGSSEIGKRDFAIIYSMLYAGLSEIEIVRADLMDLEQDLMGWYLKVRVRGHTGKGRQVRIDTDVMNHIRIYLDVRGRIRPEDPLFVSHGHRSAGDRLNTRSVRARISTHLKAAGLKRQGISPHSLTYTAPMLWLLSGISPEDVRQRMRHGSVEAMQVYLDQVEALKHQNAESGL